MEEFIQKCNHSCNRRFSFLKTRRINRQRRIAWTTWSCGRRAHIVGFILKPMRGFDRSVVSWQRCRTYLMYSNRRDELVLSFSVIAAVTDSEKKLLIKRQREQCRYMALQAYTHTLRILRSCLRVCFPWWCWRSCPKHETRGLVAGSFRVHFNVISASIRRITGTQVNKVLILQSMMCWHQQPVLQWFILAAGSWPFENTCERYM